MKKDWLLFADIILLISIGLTTLYSTVIGEERIFSGGGLINKQLIIAIIGIAMYFLFTRINYRYLGHAQVIVPLLLVTVVSLVLILIFGIRINNARRWIYMGVFNLQPSEFAKIIIIIATAWIFSLKDKINTWVLAALSLIPLLITVALIFVEPDASTSIVILGIWSLLVFTVLPNQLRNLFFVVISVVAAVGINFLLSGKQNLPVALILLGVSIVSGISWLFVFKKLRYIGLIAIIAGLMIGLTANFVWNRVLSDWQRERIESFQNPEEHSQGAAFQVEQSKVAIGSGMLLGKGFGNGTQSKLKFLPEHQTDFAFAAFAEEFGNIGVLFLLTLYGFAIFRIISIASETKDTFGMLICVGIAVKLMIEIFINIAMNMGVIPASGVPLPLISAGGSIFLATMLGFGLVQSVYGHRDEIDSSLSSNIE